MNNIKEENECCEAKITDTFVLFISCISISENYFFKYHGWKSFSQYQIFLLLYFVMCKIIIWDMVTSTSEGWKKGEEECGMGREKEGRKRVNIY